MFFFPVQIQGLGLEIWKSLSGHIKITVIQPANVLKYMDKVSEIILILDQEKGDFIIQIILSTEYKF